MQKLALKFHDPRVDVMCHQTISNDFLHKEPARFNWQVESIISVNLGKKFSVTIKTNYSVESCKYIFSLEFILT